MSTPEQANEASDGQSRLTAELGWQFMHDKRRISDDFTDVVASAMHYFERADKIDLSTCSHKELMDVQDGWLERYRNDALFHAKVQSIVSRLMHAIDA